MSAAATNKKTKYYYARSRRKQLARLLDDLFLCALSVALLSYVPELFYRIEKMGLPASPLGGLGFAPLIAILIDHMIYEPICYLIFRGTPGQYLLKMRVVDESTKVQPSLSEVTRHTLLRLPFSAPLVFGLIISYWPLVLGGIFVRFTPFLKMARNERGQNLIEKLSNLIILRKRER